MQVICAYAGYMTTRRALFGVGSLVAAGVVGGITAAAIASGPSAPTQHIVQRADVTSTTDSTTTTTTTTAPTTTTTLSPDQAAAEANQSAQAAAQSAQAAAQSATQAQAAAQSAQAAATTTTVATVTVPNLVGETRDAAANQLTALGLPPAPLGTVGCQSAAYTVVRQDVAPGTSEPVGTRIAFWWVDPPGNPC